MNGDPNWRNMPTWLLWIGSVISLVGLAFLVGQMAPGGHPHILLMVVAGLWVFNFGARLIDRLRA